MLSIPNQMNPNLSPAGNNSTPTQENIYAPFRDGSTGIHTAILPPAV